MNKSFSIVLSSFLLGVALSAKASAVVPSPLSMGDEEGAEMSTASPRSVSQVADKLAEDQRHLESVLQDLKEDQKALKEAPVQPDIKENSDGHSLR